MPHRRIARRQARAVRALGEPAELQRLLPTVIKGMRWTEGTKTGEGLLEVFLWEEMQEALVAPSAVSQKSSGEPLVVNGSSERQGWLPTPKEFQTLAKALGRQFSG